MRGSHDIGGIASMAEEEVTVQPTIGLHMTGLDCRSPFEFASHGSSQAALLPGDDDGGVAQVIMLPLTTDALRMPPISTACPMVASSVKG